MFKRLFGFGVGALATLTAACDGAPMTQQVYYKEHGVLSSLQYAASEGPLLVRVFGNPFVTGQDFLDQLVASELENTITYIKGVRLTTDPAAARRPEYRVLMVLGAHKAQDGEALCRGEEPKFDLTADPIRAVAVFCRKDERLSEVTGSVAAAASPDSERFRNWIGQIGRDLLVPG
ncbi:MAG: hypothetical protein AB7D00_01330 [Rhodospirillaceae bacterium]